MTDHELLELAAKAAEIDGWWEYGYLSFIKKSGGPWSPLEDDGDGARLEAALKLDVGWFGAFVGVNGHYENYADHGGDRQKARRRASVVAAALFELGKSLTTGANHD